MGGRTPIGPFKGIKTQRTAKGNIVGRLECPARNCGQDALAKVDGQGWLHVTHTGCLTLQGRSHNAAHEILERIKAYPHPNKWASNETESQAEAALATLLEPAKPKAPSVPTFVDGSAGQSKTTAPNSFPAPDNVLPVPEGATPKTPVPTAFPAHDNVLPVPEGATRKTPEPVTLESALKPKPEPKKPAPKRRGVSLGARKK